MRVVVFGASGVQGAAQVAALTNAGHNAVAISRNPKPLEINGRKVETVALYFDDEKAVAKVLKGADVIFVNLPTTAFQEAPPIFAASKAIGEAAKANGVPLIIFNTSMPVPDEPMDIAAHEDRRKMRQILRESGVPVISIEPVVFLDNLLEGWALPPIRDEKRVVYCHPLDLDVTWICLHDVAQLMMAAMERPELSGRNFAVAGLETVRLPELTKKLSRAWGRELDYKTQTIPEFCDTISQTMQGRGLDIDSIIKDMFRAYTYYTTSPDRPFKIDMGPVLRELPVTLTPIEDWARTHTPPGWS